MTKQTKPEPTGAVRRSKASARRVRREWFAAVAGSVLMFAVAVPLAAAIGSALLSVR